jgi:16S rRNA (uracil1498-N3)-methyltransferase
LVESAQQSRRLRVPGIGSAVRPADAFAQSDAELKLLLSERREAQSLRDALASGLDETRPVVLAIGPEGGWTDEEIAAARGSGFAEASLGESILRTETAVIAALAILRFTLSDRKGGRAHHSQTDSR